MPMSGRLQPVGTSEDPTEPGEANRMAGVTGLRDDVLDVRHVAPGGGGGLRRAAPALASVQVGRVPVPPVVWRGDRLERAVTFGGLVQQSGASGNVHPHTRPGSRCVTSC